MKHFYCSTFSKEYAYKGLLLYNSIKRHDRDFQFFMICLNNEVKTLFEKMNLTYATLISMEEVEKDDKELLTIKDSRNIKEYIWTSKASVCLYLFKHFTEIDHIVWLDGDTFFLGNPDPIFTEWADCSIALTEEKWLEEHSILGETNGIYNTGFMGFKRDPHAMECLSWFREKLIEWCFDKWEHGLWSDQVYVNDWTERFKNVGIIDNIGVNLTPYIINYRLANETINQIDNEIMINNEKVIFFHYYGFKYYDGNVFDICNYVMDFRDDLTQILYLPYINACKDMLGKLSSIDPQFDQKKEIRNYHIRNYFNLNVNVPIDKEENHLCGIIMKENIEEALQLIHSLNNNTLHYKLWICCLDDDTYSTFHTMQLSNVIPLNLKNIEGKELLSVKEARNQDEYYRTLKAFFIYYILKNNYNVKSIIYTEPEFFSLTNFGKLFDAVKRKHSIFIFKQDGISEGLYEGLLGFKRDKIAYDCLFKWKKASIKGELVKESEAVERYIAQWPLNFPDVKMLDLSSLS